jgi:predicted lipoprotein with Yx(FWY)xxD motif
VRRAIALLCLIAGLVVGALGCGGGNGSSRSEEGFEDTLPSTTSSGEPTAESESASEDGPKKGAWGAVVRAQSESLGIILFDLSGHTLYRFGGDKGSVSTCYGPCAKAWPPALTEGKVRPMEVPRTLVGTTKRKDGTIQLTYAGHPLYTHSGVRQGDTSDNGVKAFGARWYALRVSGKDATE